MEVRKDKVYLSDDNTTLDDPLLVGYVDKVSKRIINVFELVDPGLGLMGELGERLFGRCIHP